MRDPRIDRIVRTVRQIEDLRLTDSESPRCTPGRRNLPLPSPPAAWLPGNEQFPNVGTPKGAKPVGA